MTSGLLPGCLGRNWPERLPQLAEVAMKIPLDSDIPDTTNARLRDAWGELIHNSAEWTWWITLTFQRFVHQQDAARHFRRWADRVAREHIHTHYDMAWVVERAGNNSHIHALLAFPDPKVLTGKQIVASWRGTSDLHGVGYIKSFDPSKGAAWYIAKTLEPELEVACHSPRCCRRKGRRCIFR